MVVGPVPRLVLAFALAGCGSEEPAPATATTSGAGGGGGESVEGCPPGEATLPDGACKAAGVAEGECGEGFESDGASGCVAILPEAPCAAGTMAIPGETECRPVWPCGSGKWGDIPVAADTEYVDASYVAADSDGTEAKPWATIQAGVYAAAAGAIVAVAEGDYTEDVLVSATPVRLRGRCPELVRVHGAGTEITTVLVAGGADATEIGGISVDGPGIGIVVSGSEDVVIEGVRVHDTGGRGIDLENFYGATSGTVRDSLVEGARDAGIIVLTSTLSVERTVVRGMKALASTGAGRGIVARREASSKEPSTLSVSRSVVDHALDFGIFAQASNATVESTLVRDMQPNANTDENGVGIAVEADPFDGTRSTATLRTCLVERAHGEGVFIAGSDATVDRLVVRDTQPTADLENGTGLHLQNADPPGGRATVTVTASLVDANRTGGININASDVVLSSMVVRGTKPQEANGWFGRGLNIIDDPGTLERASVTLRDSVVEGNTEIGIQAIGSDLVVEHCVVRDTLSDVVEGRFGRAIEVQGNYENGLPASGTVRTSLFERNRDIAIAFVGAAGIVEDSTIRDTLPRDSDQTRGRAISVQRHIDNSAASLLVRGGTIEGSRDVGISIYLADATIENLVIRDTAARVSDGLFGDGIIVQAGKVTMTGVSVSRSDRVGIAAFSGSVTLASSSLDCNTIDLDREAIGSPAEFNDQGGNVCGCDGQAKACQIVSSNLEAPQPPD